jgi:hypothetical protein
MNHQQMPVHAGPHRARAPYPVLGGPPPAGLGGPGTYVPPPVRDVRPHLGWVVVSWLVCGVLALGGLVSGAAAAGSAMESAAPEEAFTAGQWVEVTVAPGDELIVYGTAPTLTTLACSTGGVSAAGATLRPASEDATLEVEDTTWWYAYDIVAEPGRYQLTCNGTNARFGIGTDPTSGLVAAAALMFGGPLTGVVVGVLTTIVVLVQRHEARRAQMQALLGLPVPRRPW